MTLTSSEIRPPYHGGGGFLAGASINATMVDEPLVAFRVSASSYANLTAFKAVLKIQTWPMNSGNDGLDAAYPEYSEDVTSVFLAQGGALEIRPSQHAVMRVSLTLTNTSGGTLSVFTTTSVSGLYREGESYAALGLT